MASPVPGQVPGYLLHELVGEGATATVWRGEATGSPGRVLAIKQVGVTADADAVAAVRREAEALARLSHPSVLQVVDVVDTPDGAALVTPYATGGSLATRLAGTSGGLDPVEVADLGARIASALAAAHTAGVIHRDVKPANVLFDAEGQPLLGDFGTALLAGEHHEVVGTAEYLDPTVVTGRTADAASDLYGLGVTLYEALAGVPPYAGSTPRQTLAAADRGRHVALRDLVVAPVGLTSAIEAAMARDPANRPSGAHELAARLDEARRGLERNGSAGQPPAGLRADHGTAEATGPPPPPPPAPPRDTPRHTDPAPDDLDDLDDDVDGDATPVTPAWGSLWSRTRDNAPPSWPATPGPSGATTTGDDGRSGTIRYGPARPTRAPEPAPAEDQPRFPRWVLVLAAIAVVAIPAAIVAFVFFGGDDDRVSVREAAPECDDVAAPVTDGGQILLADVEGRGCSVPIAWDGEQLAVPDSSGGIERFDLGASPDDVLLFGDWTCDGRESPALYRPSDGQVFTFDELVGAGEQASVGGEASGVIDGEPEVVVDAEGCHHVQVTEREDGEGDDDG